MQVKITNMCDTAIFCISRVNMIKPWIDGDDKTLYTNQTNSEIHLTLYIKFTSKLIAQSYNMKHVNIAPAAGISYNQRPV